MRISEILQTKGTDVVTVHPDETVRALVALLKERNLGATVVSKDGHWPIGIVSERDVVRRLADGPGVLDATVAAIMTSADAMHSCASDDSVETLRSLMTEKRVRHVPVLDEDGRLVGIVSIGDIVKSRIHELQFERDELEHYVSS